MEREFRMELFGVEAPMSFVDGLSSPGLPVKSRDRIYQLTQRHMSTDASGDEKPRSIQSNLEGIEPELLINTQ
jgi:hypothetical protein